MSLPDPAALVQAVLSEVSRLGNMLRSRSHNQLIPPKTAVALVQLRRHGPLTVPQLARMGRTSRQNTQVIVNGMLRRGWAQTIINPAHKRSALVRLTGEGEAMVQRASTNNSSLVLSLEALCPKPNLEVTLETLRRLQEGIKGCGPAPTPEARPEHEPKATRIVATEEANEALPVSLL